MPKRWVRFHGHPRGRKFLSDFVKDEGVLPVLNVREHGAMGDGAIDDRDAIQTVIDEAPDGSIIYFPEGTYLLGSRVLVDDRAGLVFAGANAASCRLVRGAGETYVALFEIRDSTGIIVSDLHFDAARDESGQSRCFTARRSDHVQVERCWFSGAKADFAVNAHETHNTTFRYCRFFEPHADAVRLFDGELDGADAPVGTNLTLDGCHFHTDTNTSWIKVENVDGVKIINCRFEADAGVTSASFDLGEGPGDFISDAFHTDYLVQGCSFKNGVIRLANPVENDQFKLLFDGCFLDDCRVDQVLNSYFPSLRFSNIVHIARSGNNGFNTVNGFASGTRIYLDNYEIICNDANNEAILVRQAEFHLRGVTVRGLFRRGILVTASAPKSTIVDCTVIKDDVAEDCIRLSVDDVLVSGCHTFRGVRGIEVAGGTRNRIVNCLCDSTSATGTGIRDTGSSGGNFIENNTVRNKTAANSIVPHASTRVRANIGTVTEAQGSGTIADGNSSVNVAHGLDYTPSPHHVVVTPHRVPASADEVIAVTAVDGTNITVSTGGNVSGDLAFSWRVQRNA